MHQAGVQEDSDEEVDLFSRDGIRRRLKNLPAQLDNQIENLKEKVKRGEEALLRSPKGKGKSSMESASSDSRTVESPDESQRERESLFKKSSRSSKGSRRSSRRRFKTAVPEDSSDTSEDEGDRDKHAFDHPSAYVEQEWIWLPKDRLGLSEMLVNDLREVGVDASDLGASMDEKGVVEVTRGPPDDEWAGESDL